jgi:hypothetical protein
MVQHQVINRYSGEEYGKHEYNIIVEDTKHGTKYSLQRSNQEHWAEGHRETVALAILNTGDGYVFSKHFKNREIDYALTSELFILLSFINRDPNGMCNLFKGDIVTSQIIDIVGMR